MSDETGIANLKAHLSEIIARVKAGKTISIFERKTKVAILSPVNKKQKDEMNVRHASKSVHVIGPVTFKLDKKIDVLAMLREDRDSR